MRAHAQICWSAGIVFAGVVMLGVPLAAQAQDGQTLEQDVVSGLQHLQHIDPARLDEQRGGADVTTNNILNEIHANGTVSSNQAYNLTTGGNAISDGSFAGANGLSTVVQNSGNNVLIQNSTIINIQLQ